MDAEGYIWLTAPYSRYLTFDTEATEYLLLSPQGEYLGRTSRPGSFGSGHVAEGMHAILVVTDEATGGRTGVVFRRVGAAEQFVYP